MNRLLCVVVSVLAVLPAGAAPLGAFSYPDSASAREHWTPQFGSLPVRVEKLPDGSTCLAFDAEFAREGDRVCWDWSAPLDLSAVDAVTCEACADNGGLARNTGVYFGPPNGWYGSFGWSGFADTWGSRTLVLSDFGPEDSPDGWDKVVRFRFSVWSSGPGKATFRLRNLRAERSDPARNLIPNGSFECPGSEVPCAWGSGHWGVGDLPWAADMDLWRRHWGLDRTVAHDDVYPIPHGAPSGAIGAVRTMAGAARAERKPVWIWLQGTGYAYWMAREPTPRELSCMAYGSLIAGARGLYYFAQVPRSRACFEEMRALCVEVEALTPVLAAEGRPVGCDAPAIMARAFRYQGQTWVVTVNTGARPVEARFDLAGVVGTGEVHFEDRAIWASRGLWMDGFGPYERHVYRFGRGR